MERGKKHKIITIVKTDVIAIQHLKGGPDLVLQVWAVFSKVAVDLTLKSSAGMNE